MLDCLWGLLDGVNDEGLAVSLTFGGRPQVGDGFGIPLVIRYVLEVCGTVGEAVDVLRRVPVHMSYNVTALDRAGGWATVYVAPDRPARVTGRAVATNHQGTVEWEPWPASSPRASAPPCTPAVSMKASERFTPPSTGLPRASPVITGPASRADAGMVTHHV